jgi:hypothetical protein
VRTAKPVKQILLLLVRRPAAGGVSAGGIDGAISFLYICNLPFLIHHERGTVGYAGLRDQNAVGGDHFAIEEIAEQRECGADLSSKFFLGGSVVRADAKNFGVVAFKFRNTSLVCSDFARSTTGKGCGEECQHHGVFPYEAGKRHLPTLGGRQGEVRRHVAYLEGSMRRLDVLSQHAYRTEAGSEQK